MGVGFFFKKKDTSLVNNVDFPAMVYLDEFMNIFYNFWHFPVDRSP